MSSPQLSSALAELHDAMRESARLRRNLQQTRKDVEHHLATVLYSSQSLYSGLSSPIAPSGRKHVESLPRTIDPRDEKRLSILTDREREVLRLIGEGERTKEIAYQLGITFKTAVTHRSNIMDKVGIHEGPNLVRFAIRTGLCVS